MAQQRAGQKQICMGALGVGAVLALPQLFVQPAGAPAGAAPPATGTAASAPEARPQAAGSAGVAPAVGLGLVGTAALVARVGRGSRSSRAAPVARQFFGGGGSSSSYAFDPANEAGVQDPVGFWDPLGFSDDKDEATFKRRRAVEIKHGRICMYATIGYMVPEYYKFPGYLSPSQGLQFSDVPNGLGALSKVPLAGWLQILAFAGLIETSGFFSGSSVPIGFMQDSTQDGTPGDYGVGFPNFIGTVEDPEAKKSKLAAELANGRLAMVAIIGMFFQDGLTGSAWGDWSLYTASPLRAFENEFGVQSPSGLVGTTARVARAAPGGRTSRSAPVARQFFGGGSSSSYYAFDPANEAGVQDPVGFWDPLGFSDDKDEATFKRRRAVEIKHGRICMYATIGYMVPEYYKFPGYLSPSQGLQFSDVPNGLGALSKVPLAGWLQILAFAGLIETSGFFSGSSVPIGFMQDSTQDGTPGDYGVGFPNFIGTVEDPEAKKSKLAAELANGRLAMVAIIGMFFQDGLTGSAWGDWSLYTASPLRAIEQ